MKPQLAATLDDLNKFKFPCLAEIKYDGVRVIARVPQDIHSQVMFMTRNGKMFHYPKLGQYLINSLSTITLSDYFIDGELVIGPGKSAERTSISGRVNSAIHDGNLWQGNEVLKVFDIIMQDNPPLSLASRRVFLTDSIINNEMIQVADQKECKTVEDANSMFSAATSQGFEGLILKQPDSFYYPGKRNKAWIKMKAINTMELICIDIQEGQGKYTGMIGALICKGPNNIEVSVGSGLSDYDRAQPVFAYVGKTIEVKFNQVIPAFKGGGKTLFLPRFICVREDK